MQLILPPFTAAVIRVYDEAGNVIETHEHAGERFNRRTKEFDW
jgi:hypothetical protein